MKHMNKFPSYQDPLWLSAAVSFGLSIFAFAFAPLFLFVNSRLQRWWATLGTVTHTVQLFLVEEGTGFKFRMNNGKITEVSQNE